MCHQSALLLLTNNFIIFQFHTRIYFLHLNYKNHNVYSRQFCTELNFNTKVFSCKLIRSFILYIYARSSIFSKKNNSCENIGFIIINHTQYTSMAIVYIICCNLHVMYPSNISYNLCIYLTTYNIINNVDR